MGGKVYVSLAAVKDLIKQEVAEYILVATETGYKYIENPADSLIKRIEAIQDTIYSVDIQNPCWWTQFYTPSAVPDLVAADREGRLKILPCQIGDSVYTVQGDIISELSVSHFEIYNDGIWVSWELISGIYGNFRMDGFPASDIGKTVFLTLAEAEAYRRTEKKMAGGADA